jgi:DNA ligase (NAD+)
MQLIQAPKHCPSCGSTLEWSNNILYCRSNTCSSQSKKKLEHFAKTLKIKGLGPSAIDKLELMDIPDLYDLDLNTVCKKMCSERLGVKLYSEIENSRKAPMNILLSAFSIPLVGQSATEKLSKVCTSLFDITTETCKDAGLGPKVTENLLNWIGGNETLISVLPFSFDFILPREVSKVMGTVCISGKLTSFKTKAQAQEVLVANGYIVKSSVTKDVTILVNESGIESTKTKKARDSGVTIVENLQQFLMEK